jgi:hypothetical protein
MSNSVNELTGINNLSENDILKIKCSIQTIELSKNNYNKICDLLNRCDLKEFQTNKIIDIFNCFLQIIFQNFPKKSTVIYDDDDDRPPMSLTLSDRNDFSIIDSIFSRMLYTYAMFLIANKLDGNSFLRNFYSNDILNVLKKLSNNKESKDVVLDIFFNNKTITMNLKDECIDGGRYHKCNILISEENDNLSCSRIHFLILSYHDKFGHPTIAIIDPGSYLGISDNKYKRKVHYLDLSENNKTLLNMGSIPVEFSVKVIDN